MSNISALTRIVAVANLFAAGLMVLSSGVASGQTPGTGAEPPALSGSGQIYPNKPIRLFAPGAGGIADFSARVLAQGLSGGLGQQVVVDNRAGLISAEIVSKAPPDGYTLLLAGSSLWIQPLMQDNVPYDAIRDFAPISLTTSVPNLLVVHPSLNVKSVTELILLARSRPGELNYAMTSGGTTHLAGELFKAMTGVRIESIAYKSTAMALNDVISGQVQLEFASVASAAPHVTSGRLKALAITSARPSALFPGVPAVAASVPGYEAAALNGILAPDKTPAAVISKLSLEVSRVLNRAEVKERFFNAGADVAATSPEQFSAAIKGEIARLGRVIRDARIRTN